MLYRLPEFAKRPGNSPERDERIQRALDVLIMYNLLIFFRQVKFLPLYPEYISKIKDNPLDLKSMVWAEDWLNHHFAVVTTGMTPSAVN
jgi:hypothetical protein